jgi:hypothetical protein
MENRTITDLVEDMMENNIPLRPTMTLQDLLKETMDNLPENVRMTRLVRRLNTARQCGYIKDYKINKVDNEYFYELM